MTTSTESLPNEFQAAVEVAHASLVASLTAPLGGRPRPRAEAEPDAPEPALAPAGEVHVEAVVPFHGAPQGAVVLRASLTGRLDAERARLWLAEDRYVDLGKVAGLLAGAAGRVTGALRRRVLDARGICAYSAPSVATRAAGEPEPAEGRVALQLAKGAVTVEVRLDEDTQ